MVRIHLGQPHQWCAAASGDVLVSASAGQRIIGDVAQLVELLVCNQEVVGSSPVVSTIRRSPLAVASGGSDGRGSSSDRDRGTEANTVTDIGRCSDVLFDKLGWWNEIVEDLE